jgi:DedD protein
MDIALKQRLVGASVLIALAVVVLPMLLGGRPEQVAQQRQKIELPPQPAELDFETRRYPIGETPAAAAPEPANPPVHAPARAPAQSPAQSSDSSAAQSSDSSAAQSSDSSAANSPSASPAGSPAEAGAVAHVEVQPRDFEDALQGGQVAQEAGGEVAAPAASERGARDAVQDASAAEPPTEPVPLADAPAGSGRFVVQVASFASIANANRLSETLRTHGHGVLTDTVQSDVGTLHRVRIGPYASEAEANEAAARVSTQVRDVKPRVVDLQPAAAAPATAPSDSLVRWVVQVGSFSAAGNAEMLVERLRAEGLSAYQETVSSSGSTIYRVRVGPFLERDEAIRVDDLVGERLSLDGVVMSAD